MTGFFDLQVNGYGGVDFNQEGLTAEGLHTACERMAADGVTGFLATMITDHVDVMASRLARVVELVEQDELAKQMIAGYHIEGPFISPVDGYRGAHPADAVQLATIDAAKKLVDACRGQTKIVTLAPEQDPGGKVTAWLKSQGVVVSAGHTNASMDELKTCIDAGLSMYTHLGNGCPMMMHRHDNIVQRALSLCEHLCLCFIADGVHVALPALGNYLRAAGIENCAVVTDAVAPAGLGPGQYTVSRWKVQVGEDLAVRSPDGSHLIGSAIDMPRNIHNLCEKLGLSEADARRLTCDNPRRALGLAV